MDILWTISIYIIAIPWNSWEVFFTNTWKSFRSLKRIQLTSKSNPFEIVKFGVYFAILASVNLSFSQKYQFAPPRNTPWQNHCSSSLGNNYMLTIHWVMKVKQASHGQEGSKVGQSRPKVGQGQPRSKEATFFAPMFSTYLDSAIWLLEVAPSGLSAGWVQILFWGG